MHTRTSHRRRLIVQTVAAGCYPRPAAGALFLFFSGDCSSFPAKGDTSDAYPSAQSEHTRLTRFGLPIACVKFNLQVQTHSNTFQQQSSFGVFQTLFSQALSPFC
ncbi:hypothetical protein SDJN03_06933, partial [Cucurbita argyrosperma subsp. sororia]